MSCWVGATTRSNLRWKWGFWPYQQLGGRSCLMGLVWYEHMFDTVSSGAGVSAAESVLRLREAEREVASIRAGQVRELRRLAREAGVEFSAGELAACLDVSVGTARRLLEAAQRTPERSEAMASLSCGDWSFDRAAAMASLVGAGADEVTLESARERDIAGVVRLRGLWRRISRRSEAEAHRRRSVRCWASLDESVGFVYAELSGYDWRVVAKALDDRGDLFPGDAGDSTAQQRRADALVAIAQDWLDGSRVGGGGAGAVVTVMVDAALAAATDAEAGVALSSGPRVGVETLERIMCVGSVEVVVDAGSGVPLAVGPTTRVVPPKMRRFVLNRDGGCTIDGCGSSYRLEVHHIVPRSRGGTHDAENLTTLCWWHHHIAIHGQGKRIDPNSPPLRRRLLPAETNLPP